MNRRNILKSVVAGCALLSGCSSSLSEPPEPETVAESQYPSYTGTVELDADEDFWVLKMPSDYPSEAVYRYEIENLNPNQGMFDILFFNYGNYRDYIDRNDPTWYAPLTSENVNSVVEKSARIQGYGSGIIQEEVYIVIDNTDYAAADPIEAGRLQARVDAEVYPGGIGPKPPVGEFSLERIPDSIEREDLPPINGNGPEWNVKLILAKEFGDATIKINDCSNLAYKDPSLDPDMCLARNAGTPDDRRTLSDTTGLERFDFRTTNGLSFQNKEYLFIIDTDKDILAESIMKIDRSLELLNPQFESISVERIPRNNISPGKVGFSVEVKNTGPTPLWLGGIQIEGDIGKEVGEMQIPDPFESGYTSDFNFYQLVPGDSQRFVTGGYNLPTIETVEEVCNGESRTVTLTPLTWGRGVEAKYELEYILNEPAREVTPEYGSNSTEYYACESGEIRSFNRVDSQSG